MKAMAQLLYFTISTFLKTATYLKVRYIAEKCKTKRKKDKISEKV